MPEESPSRYPTRKREAVKRLAMQHGGKSYDEHTLTQMISMSMIADKHAPKKLSLNKGLRVWGERGMSSVKGELSQFHRNVYRPADSHKLTWIQKKEDLESHMFLEEKRNLDIKGRIVAGVKMGLLLRGSGNSMIVFSTYFLIDMLTSPLTE